MELNPEGYNRSRIANADGFKSISGSVLLQHGTGDDNVHFQNSLVLEDHLVDSGVPPQKLDVQWFTDSNHNIRFHGANAFLYKQLTGKLWEEKNRKVGTQPKHQWSRRKVQGKIVTA